MDREPGADTSTEPSPLAGQRVAERLLPALADPARYRVGTLPGAGLSSLVCQDLRGDWWWLADCRDAAQAVAMTERLVDAANGERRSLYLVEWTLLRHAARGREDAQEPSSPAADEFSFRGLHVE